MGEVRALLLTDVVDSTELAVSLGDAGVAALWTAHDRLARDLLPSWGGREIDKTDGMLLLFDRAADAAGYALAYQRSLASLDPPLRARAGLHVGPVVLRENSKTDVALGAKPLEVEGAAKAMAARIMSVASGGQILLSAAAREALEAPALHLLSHGHWRLKGLAEPIELFEVGAAGTPFSPPTDAAKAYRVVRQGDLWLPARGIRHSLPAERDSFVGREQALLELGRRVTGGARLVSILGLGGTGKTRLATHFGWAWLGDFPGGVWFCDLSPARSLDGLVHAVAQGLEVPLGKSDPVVQLGHAIAGHGDCLVILDNFEQVTRHAQDTLGRWLSRAAGARFLVTTREVLGLPGEEVFALAPLQPAESADLFMRRAQAARFDFMPGTDDRAAITPLVDLLEGLPLAIELAAARVRVMPPRTLLLRMSERFKLLASSGGRVDRQATLRGVFDWSWELLSLPEKAALAQLSVFEGGLALEAAEAVLDLSPYAPAPWLPDVLQSLVQKSFLHRVDQDRFALLASVQEYAAEHLCTEGRYRGSGPGALKSAQLRHIAWFAALGPARSIEGNCADLQNLVTACRRAVTLGDGDSAAGALEGAWAALSLRGPYETGVALAEAVCAMPRLDDRALARALSELAHASVACGRPDSASTLYARALACARAAGDRRCETQLNLRLGALFDIKGQFDQARACYGKAARMAQEIGDRQLECSAINGLGNSERSQGGLDRAMAHYRQALALAREMGDRRMQGNLLGNLSTVYSELGLLESARTHAEDALALARAIGHRQLEGTTLCNLAMLQILQGRHDEAETASKAALVLARELGYLRLEGTVLCNLAIALERLARPAEALAQFEAALRIARALGDPRSEGEFLGYLGLLQARQGQHADARRSLDCGEALLRASPDLVALGVLMSSRAEAHHLAGERAAAADSLAAAASLAAQLGAGPASEIKLAIARVTALIEAGQVPPQ